MNWSNFLRGLVILHDGFENPDGFHIGAEHDAVYVYANDKPLSDEAVASLKALGWHQSDVHDDVNGIAQYDPTEGWCAYV